MLGTDRSIYAPDAPGCGESDAPKEPAGGAYAVALVDFLDSMRLRQVDVLACGDSVTVVAEVMRERPELVRRRLDVMTNDLPLLQSQPQAIALRARTFFD